jgi:hypothetical protein
VSILLLVSVDETVYVQLTSGFQSANIPDSVRER